MKSLLMIVTCLISTASMAVGIGNDNPPSEGGSQTQQQQQGQLQGQAQLRINENNNRITSDTRSAATAFAGSASGSSSTSSVTSGGNQQNITVTDSGRVRYSGELRNVPNVQVSNVYPTAPCMGGTSVGGSGVGFGVSFGTSWTDGECTKRETARSFAGLGLVEDAVAILCSSEAAAVAPSCKAKAVATE